MLVFRDAKTEGGFQWNLLSQSMRQQDSFILSLHPPVKRRLKRINFEDEDAQIPESTHFYMCCSISGLLLGLRE